MLFTDGLSNYDDQLIRSPTYIDDLGSVTSEERRFKQWSNRGSAVLSLRPGGGALQVNVGYTNQLAIYDSLEANGQELSLLGKTPTPMRSTPSCLRTSRSRGCSRRPKRPRSGLSAGCRSI